MNSFLRLRHTDEYLKYDKIMPVFSGNSFLPQRAFVPISQTCNSTPTPVVSRGEYVSEGQVIAKSYNSYSADVHAPIPGIIGELLQFEGHNGKPIYSIPIKLDGKFNLLGRKVPNYPWKGTAPSEMIRIIANKGLINTAYKNISLATYIKQKIKKSHRDFYICLFDNDPSSGLDDFLVNNFLDNVLEGIAIISRALDTKKLFILHKFKNKKAKELKLKLEQVLSGIEYECFFAKHSYPFYKNKLKHVDSMFLIDPSTAINTYEAVVRDKPIISNYVILGGHALKTEKVFKARLGTPIGNLLEDCGGLTFQPDYIIINGLINGYAINNFDIPVDKTMKSIHAISNTMFKPYEVRDCENCGRCVTVCPYNINPIEVVRRIQRNEYTKEVLRQIEICGSCNSCSCVCASRIPLSSIIKKAKEEIIK
ncbi:MAG: hypothetical protein CR988_06860 [Treponema sp.]|nr:MAG: hypothetical protein CR988_06860 [Treponema sp.]